MISAQEAVEQWRSYRYELARKIKRITQDRKSLLRALHSDKERVISYGIEAVQYPEYRQLRKEIEEYLQEAKQPESALDVVGYVYKKMQGKSGIKL